MTSYVMCNKKKLGIKKTDIECLKKSVEDRKFEYFKSELLKILDKKEKEENGEEVSKAFIVQELYKSMIDPLYIAKGGRVGVVGEVRTWKGKKYKKMPDKKWVRVYDKETRGAKMAIAALRRKIDACTDSQELLNLVLQNKERFCDELGRPLPIVQELSKYVSARNDKIESAKGKTNKKPKEKSGIEKAKDLLQSSDSSSVTTLKQFKAWTDRIKFFLPSMKVLKGDENAKFVISLNGSKYENDVEKFENEFKAIFDDKFDFDGTESSGGIIKYFYNPLKQDEENNRMYHAGSGGSEQNSKNEDKPQNDGRFDFTSELKQKAVDVLNNPTEKINYVDYTRENYNKLFPRGECQTPLGTIKLSPNQFERFATKDNGERIKFMGALQQCLQRPDVIIGKTDNKNRYSKLYLKAFLDNNGKKAYLAVVPNIKGIDVVVSNSPRDTKDIAKEIKKAGICYYIRPALTSSANSGGSHMENSADGLTSNNSRNEEVKPSDNSNIAQDYTVVNKKDKENPAVKKSFASIVNELKKSYFDNIGA